MYFDRIRHFVFWNLVKSLMLKTNFSNINWHMHTHITNILLFGFIIWIIRDQVLFTELIKKSLIQCWDITYAHNASQQQGTSFSARYWQSWNVVNTTFHDISCHFKTFHNCRYLAEYEVPCCWGALALQIWSQKPPVTQWNTNDVRKSIFMPFYYQNWKKLENGQKIL